MTRPEGYWIGHPGALLALPDVQGGLSRKAERGMAFATSASGRNRAYLSARRSPLREWSVTIPRLRPNEAAVLHGLLANTEPPYMWVDPWSLATNLLTPDASTMRVTQPLLAPMGRYPLSGGGFAPTAVANPERTTVRVQPAPVVFGMPVTGSAFVASPADGARVTVQFLDSNGAYIGGSATGAGVLAGVTVLQRVHVTALPPFGAVAVELSVVGASVIAQPAVTWTDEVLQFGAGGGAAQVVVSGVNENILWAMRTADGQRWADLSFNVTEVG